MSVPTTQAGKNIPLTMSFDAGVTYKNLTCEVSHDLTFDKAVTQESSDCGKHTSLDQSALTMAFAGIVNTTPNGATEASSDDVIDAYDNETLVYIITQHGNRWIQAQGYINNLVLNKLTNELLKYNLTFTADGDHTTTTSDPTP